VKRRRKRQGPEVGCIEVKRDAAGGEFLEGRFGNGQGRGGSGKDQRPATRSREGSKLGGNTKPPSHLEGPANDVL